MKITKFVHSCLLVEEKDTVILIDPGNYTFEEKALDISKIAKLDYLLVTHEHQDHMHIPFIKQIVQKFPTVNIISANSVANILKKGNISVQTTRNEFISIEQVPHEKLMDSEPPENVLFKIFNKLTHPGDSLHFKLSTPILALPIQAPWGSMIDAISLAVSLKPEIVIPIHDWHWKDQARKNFYKRIGEHFKKLGIEFKGVETGEIIELD